MSSQDKARFYLEQSVPELHELERKGLFSKEEITAIAKKRSEFEHIINARGPKPSDFARYVEYEMNLEALRKKRAKRLGVKAGHQGQRRIFFIFDRALRKHHGDLGLWMEYLNFARKEKANKKLKEILTSVLRMHPAKAELWVWAARWAMDFQADMTGARAYMQRGLRFCKNSRFLWLEYTKLEMIYVAKIAARRQILGLDQERKAAEPTADDPDADMIALPDITAEDIDPSLKKEDGVDQVALENLANSPVLSGAIPRAIFDAAMNHFDMDPILGEQFFDLFSEFDRAPCTKDILQHVVNSLSESKPTAVSTQACSFRLPLFGVEPSSPLFPPALGETLQRIKVLLQSSQKSKSLLAEKALRFLLPLLRQEDLDQSLRKVLSASVRQFIRELEDDDHVANIAVSLQQSKRAEDASTLVVYGAKHWPSSDRLLQAQTELNGSRAPSMVR
ncbi:U3 small nucleolar RNA-associated protein 6-domain-containing protein [Phyllosticta citribraziliensis]|uniref:U3 small nucleolar RNA-associated protein 6-domain-containing protein n=1 Tax=Phyllosticta citribraziliensis TaxID=989973 RepID=A0ABR1L3K8_9PEZI